MEPRPPISAPKPVVRPLERADRLFKPQRLPQQFPSDPSGNRVGAVGSVDQGRCPSDVARILDDSPPHGAGIGCGACPRSGEIDACTGCARRTSDKRAKRHGCSHRPNSLNTHSHPTVTCSWSNQVSPKSRPVNGEMCLRLTRMRTGICALFARGHHGFSMRPDSRPGCHLRSDRARRPRAIQLAHVLRNGLWSAP
jgi:hypothetical protein